MTPAGHKLLVCVSHLPGLPQDSEVRNRQKDSGHQAQLSLPSTLSLKRKQGTAKGEPGVILSNSLQHKLFVTKAAKLSTWEIID